MTSPDTETPEFQMPEFQMPEIEIPEIGMPEIEIPLPFQELLRPHLPYAAAGPLGAADDLAALGLDSMAVVQLLSDIEAEFGVELPDEILDEATFATAGSLWAAVSALVGSGADAA